jgi:YopX protein
VQNWLGKRGISLREIKFRAWDSEEKHMYECVSVACTRENKWITMIVTKNGFIDSIQNEHVLMQYTGLKVNGKEIYEGDVLKDDENFLWKVTYHPGYFALECDDLIALEPISVNRVMCSKVIGNIYENPELLDDDSESEVKEQCIICEKWIKDYVPDEEGGTYWCQPCAKEERENSL